MSTEPINYEAVLADLEARKSQLESAIQAIRAIANMPTGATSVTPSSTTNGGSIATDAFLGMSITEATKKLLTMQRRRIGTPEIIKLLVQGGAPEPAYNTAYAVLRRRQMVVGDIVNINGEWGLKEWTPNYKAPSKPMGAKKKDEAEAENTEETIPGEVLKTDDPNQLVPIKSEGEDKKKWTKIAG